MDEGTLSRTDAPRPGPVGSGPGSPSGSAAPALKTSIGAPGLATAIGLLSRGDRGAAVTALQSALNVRLRRLPPLRIDGIFGPRTDAAVRSFQLLHGLRVDGIVGPRTRQVLLDRETLTPGGAAAPAAAAAAVAAPRPATKPPADPTPVKVKVTLVEIVEVVTRAAEGVVTGATSASGKLSTVASRTAMKGSAYKQYINLDKDLEGAAKRHPEYGTYVEVKARVECTGGPLSGHSVIFSYALTPGPLRPGSLKAAQKEGFATAGGSKTYAASTDGEGWTESVKFYLSQYAGDAVTITAEATEDKGNKKSTKPYQTWRLFWYQVTRASTHNVPAPSDSVTAYDKVCADMTASDEVTFSVADAPAHTFYPGWMVRRDGGDASESVIGAHNSAEFYKKFKSEPARPVKGHLIICQHQWDPFGSSDLLTVTVHKSPTDELMLNLGGAWNAGILKPTLSGDLIVVGTWSGGGKNGTLSADNINIIKGRTWLNSLTVTLPPEAPDPTKQPVTLQLKLRYGKFYAGESNGHQMLIKYDGAAANFNQVVSHEFGHGFAQVPSSGHANYYTDEHGGVGPHCSTGATLVADAQVTSGQRYQGGTCIMFHQVNPEGCLQVFCSTCEPHLRLQDFSALGLSSSG
jgi:peptidoglycan hydrolase-like protein with peptidoglycan-binding domain